LPVIYSRHMTTTDIKNVMGKLKLIKIPNERFWAYAKKDTKM